MVAQLQKIFLLIVSLLFVQLSYAQETNPEAKKTVIKTISGDSVEDGGYGAFSIGYTNISGLNALAIGGRGVWLMNSRLGIGVAADGFRTAKGSSVYSKDDKAYFAGGYFGLLLEPSFFVDRPVHLAIPVIIGGGGITYVSDAYYNDPSLSSERKPYDIFFAFEPGIELEMNMTKNLSISLGVSYRLTSEVDVIANVSGTNVDVMGENEMNGFITRLIFKFGKF